MQHEALSQHRSFATNVKLGLHIAQAVLGLVIFIMEIVLFTATDSKINGNNGWPFGLVSRLN